MAGQRPLRVLQVIGSMDIGGAENVVMSLVNGLDPSRYQVGVCCTRFLGALGERLLADRKTVLVAAPRRRWTRHVTPLLLARAVSRFGADVVHTHGTPALLHAGPLALAGWFPPWVHTFHHGNYPLASAKQMLGERLFSPAATQLVAVADRQREALAQCLRMSPGRILTVVNGVADNPFLHDEVLRCRVRAGLGFHPSDVVVGCVAVLRPQKGLAFLIEAAGMLVDRHPRLRVLIAGGGPEEGALRARVEALGLESRVVITGWHQDNQRMLCALDVFAMPSLWEAMPLALLEAMAARRPAVVTDVAENARIVDQGACALLVPPCDAPALASAIARLVEQPELGRGLASRAYQRYLERFGTATMVAAYERLYEESSGYAPTATAHASVRV